MTFHGATFNYELDFHRLATQQERVEALMADHQWRTLTQIKDAIGAVSEAGVSARLRSARTRGWTVERQRVGDPKRGLWAYRMHK